MTDSKKRVLSQEEELLLGFKKNKLYRLLLEDQRSAPTPEKRKKAKEEIDTFFNYYKEKELKEKK